MIVLITALILLAIITAVISKFFYSNDNSPIVANEGSCGTCDGTNDKCEQECMMEAATKEIEYFDDEELDAYRGKEADTYTDEEAEQFREILYTMKQEEVAEWNRSLILREINMPNQIKDEVTMLIGG